MRWMETLLTWLGTAFGALFVVAVLVAWWEHLVRNAGPPVRHETPEPRAVSVDVQLDKLAETPAGDTVERRATLDGAVDRATQASADKARAAWTETSPMVLHTEARSEAPAPASSGA